MKKKLKTKQKDFDAAFDQGNISINFRKGMVTEGLSKGAKGAARYVRMLRKASRHQADQTFLQELRDWEKSHA